MREYYVTVKYFNGKDSHFVAELESDDLKIVEDEIRRIVQEENDMMRVKGIFYEMKPKNISCH